MPDGYLSRRGIPIAGAAGLASLPFADGTAQAEKFSTNAGPNVYLDPGHGGSDNGATASGLKEKWPTLDFQSLQACDLPRFQCGTSSSGLSIPDARTTSTDMRLNRTQRGFVEAILKPQHHIRRSIITAAMSMMLLGIIAMATATPGSAAVVGNTPSAQTEEVGTTAHPTGCWYDRYDWGVIAGCSQHNGGSYRAMAVCKDADDGSLSYRYGTWRQWGPSYAYCQGTSRTVSSGIYLSPRNNT